MPIHRRLPKRGFKNIFMQPYHIVNLKDLDRFEANSSVDLEVLKQAGLIKARTDRVKLLGLGEVKSPLVVKVHSVSGTAREKIEAAGGKIVVI